MCCQRAGKTSQVLQEGRGMLLCVLLRGDHCLALQRRDGESPQVHRQQQRLREASLPPSNTAQEHSQPLQRSLQQHHTDFQGVWYPGLNSTASQSHTPKPTGAGEGSTAAPGGQEESPACRLICTSTNKKWKCLPSRATNSCNRICA